MGYETIIYSVEDGVAKIIFNRPDAGHSINRVFAHEFMNAAMEATTNPDVRCILISATSTEAARTIFKNRFLRFYVDFKPPQLPEHSWNSFPFPIFLNRKNAKNKNPWNLCFVDP